MKYSLKRVLMVAAVVLFAINSVAADVYPSRPIRIVVNTAPGGLTDVMSRLVGLKMAEKLGQSVIIENKAGADGLLGIRAVKAAPADGYTLLGAAGTVAIQPAVKLDPGYDLVKDFAGVGPMIRSPLLMVQAPSEPDKTLADFIARAKANPGAISYASAGVGTTTHLGAAMMFKQAGINVMHVPYKGNGAAMTDVMAGRVSTIFEAYGSGATKVKAGQLKVLGVTSTKRLPGLPDVPTLAEAGVPSYNYYLWLGVLAPAGTPREVLVKLNEALQFALKSPELAERIQKDGSEAMLMSNLEFDDFLKKEAGFMQKMVADLGITKQ